MPSLSDDGLLLSIAGFLTARQADAKAIKESLKLLCDAFSFDCGLVYGIDQQRCFQLKECCTLRDVPLRELFALEDIEPECRARLVEGTVSFMAADDGNAPHEAALLRLFSAASLAVCAIGEERTGLIGLLVLAGAGAGKPLSGSDRDTLALLLPLLGNYAGIRIYQDNLSFTRGFLENLLDNTGIDIYINDFHTHEILYVNKSMAAPYGGVSEFLGKTCWKVLFPGQTGPCDFCPQKEIVDEQGNPTKVYVWNYQRPFDGSWFRVFSAAFRWMDGRLAHLVSSADITENKRNEARIEYLANYDQLTGLPNRRMLVNECRRRIEHTTKDEKGYVLFFDIDGFKAVNDTFGHDAGDEFLVRIGEFFSGIPMVKGAVYRNGGDEFVAIVGGGDITKDNISSLAGFILERFNKPWIVKNQPVFCGISVGVACYPEDGITAEALLQKADQAMYHVKKSGGGGLCFGRQLGEEHAAH